MLICRSAPAPAGAPAAEGGNQAPPNLTSNRRLQQTQAQVDEVSEPHLFSVNNRCIFRTDLYRDGTFY